MHGFGKIEAHEAINAVARETLLVAKKSLRVAGFDLVHAIVDSVYVWREAQHTKTSSNLPRKSKSERTFFGNRVCLPIRCLPSIEAISGCSVPNRFFAVGEDGEVKVRGLECRRHDTPPLLNQMQREVLLILAEAYEP